MTPTPEEFREMQAEAHGRMVLASEVIISMVLVGTAVVWLVVRGML